MPNNSKLANLYSKIKDIYIELPDYSYFHSPSSIDRKDSRFVGRKELASRLRNILCNSQTKSGAYLVTGYRGVGKTSLVNRVLKEISEVPSIFSIVKPHLRGIAYITVLYYLINSVLVKFFEFEFVRSTCQVLLALSLFLLLKQIFFQEDLFKNWTRKLRSFLSNLIDDWATIYLPNVLETVCSLRASIDD